MKLAGLIRLGRDAELRYTPQGKPVLDIAAAWNFGRKDEATGKKPTQWAKLSLWGDRAEALAESLKKGRQYFVVCGDVNVETYEKRDGGHGFNLVGRVESLDFCDHRDDAGGERQERQAPPAPAPRAQRAPAPAPKSSSSFDDMDDDIPF